MTAIVGAGPAGLLTALLCRLRWDASSSQQRRWDIYLFDKRSEYARQHRLRIDPAPYRQLGEEIDSPVFDQLLEFLESAEFRPTVNVLEARLLDLVGQVGITKELALIGHAPGGIDLAGLRRMLEGQQRLKPPDRLTIVGSDSVHSAVRSLAAPGASAIEEVHHLVARLRVDGEHLSPKLSAIETYKLAKLLGSIIDYRLNENGYAEVDLFVAPSEHSLIEALGARPESPVMVSDDTLPKAPFFSQIVKKLSGSDRQVAVQSTFRLEARLQERFVIDTPEGAVLLVGDAALSLPYFRGMAALASSAAALSEALVDWARSLSDVSLHNYGRRVDEIRQREHAIIRSRARLLTWAQEFVRLSSLMPFPLQQWFLSDEPADKGSGRMTAGVGLNLAVALCAGLIAILAPILGATVWPPLGWFWLASLPVQFLGGVLYALTRTHEPKQNPLLGRVWRLQLAVVGLTGILTTVFASLNQGRVAQIFGAFGWFLLGLIFAIGYITFEQAERRTIDHASLR